MNKQKEVSNLPIVIWTLAIAAVTILPSIWFWSWLNAQRATLAPSPAVNSTATTKTTATATPAATASTKTYADTAYGYSVQYPSGWTLDTSGRSTSSVYGNNAIYITSPATAQRQTAVRAAGGGMNTSVFADVVINYYATIADTYSGLGGAQPTTLQALANTMTDPVATTFAGQPAYEGIASGDASAYKILVQKNNHIYEIRVIGSGHDSKSDLTTTEQTVLSSFKFAS